MTIIAFKDGVLAADSAFVQEDMMFGTAEKIWRRQDGTLVGGHGDAGYCEQFREWVMSGEEGEPPAGPETEDGYSCGLIVRPDCSLEIHTPRGVLPFNGPYYAMGSGSALAIGAMAFGATAQEAVQIAADHCCWCGGPITSLRAGSQ